jgi:hypothetical protein
VTRLARLRDVFVPGEEPQRAFFCTYGFAAPFFESEILPALLPKSLSLDREAGSTGGYLNAADTALQRRDVGVFYDHLDGEGEGPQLRYGTWAVNVRPGAFHAKLMLLDYGDRVRAVISSANLTPSAWTRNLELFVVEDLTRGASHSWAGGLRAFVRHLVDQIPETQAVYRETLGGLLADISPAVGTDRVSSTWQEPLLAALFTDLERPRHIDVVTPFFEGVHGSGVFDAITARAPEITGRLYVATTTDNGRAQVTGPAEKLDALLAGGRWTMRGVRQTWDGDEPDAPLRGLHGKMLALEHAGGTRVMLGSANVTRAALLGPAKSAAAPGHGNVELTVFRDMTTGQARGVLPQSDPLSRAALDLVDPPDDFEETAPGPEFYVIEATYYGRQGELEVVLREDAPPLMLRYEDRIILDASGTRRRTPLILGTACYIVADDGTMAGVVPFTVVDAHLLVPRGSRSRIGLEDFLDVLAGQRELPLAPEGAFGARDHAGLAKPVELAGRSGPIPWRRFLAAIHGLGQEIERERSFERGLQFVLESPVRLKGLRDQLEQARAVGRLTPADLLYALYELSRELTRIHEGRDATGRDLIAAACADVDARRAEVASTVPRAVVDQLRILAMRDSAQ